jgi:hypothetical protein
MSTEGAQPPSGPQRLRRIESAVLELEGVASVRVWELEGAVEIGVRVAPACTVADVLGRVSELSATLREGEERWEVGVLDEG